MHASSRTKVSVSDGKRERRSRRGEKERERERRESKRKRERECGRKRECFFTAVPRQINDGDARVRRISSCAYNQDLESRRPAMDIPMRGTKTFYDV